MAAKHLDTHVMSSWRLLGKNLSGLEAARLMATESEWIRDLFAEQDLTLACGHLLQRICWHIALHASGSDELFKRLECVSG